MSRTMTTMTGGGRRLVSPWIALIMLTLTAPWPARVPASHPTRLPRSAVMLASPPQYQQIYISSCEAAATHIALQMAGVRVSEQHLIGELPMDRRPPIYDYDGTVVRWGDPYRAFVGNIARGDTWPLVSYGVYTPPIVRLLRRHGMTGSYGGSFMTVQELRRALDAGHPVIVWVPKLSLYWYKPTLERHYWTTWQGQVVPWSQEEHAQVLVGYDATGFWLDNPDYVRWSNGVWLWHYTLAEFQRGWDILDDQAIVVMRRPIHHTQAHRSAHHVHRTQHQHKATHHAHRSPKAAHHVHQSRKGTPRHRPTLRLRPRHRAAHRSMLPATSTPQPTAMPTRRLPPWLIAARRPIVQPTATRPPTPVPTLWPRSTPIQWPPPRPTATVVPSPRPATTFLPAAVPTPTFTVTPPPVPLLNSP